MWKKCWNFTKSLFSKKPSTKPQSQPYLKVGDKDGDVTILSQAQLDKRTTFKVGESYRLGDCIVTLRASKAEVQKIIAECESRVAAKEAARNKRAIDLMLMSPEELMQLQLEEWLAKRVKHESIVHRIMGALGGKRYIAPESIPPSGKVSDQFRELMRAYEAKEKMAVLARKDTKE